MKLKLNHFNRICTIDLLLISKDCLFEKTAKQPLLDLFKFDCKVVELARAFCRLLRSNFNNRHLYHHRLMITKKFKADLAVSKTILQSYNGMFTLSLVSNILQHSDHVKF